MKRPIRAAQVVLHCVSCLLHQFHQLEVPTAQTARGRPVRGLGKKCALCIGCRDPTGDWKRVSKPLAPIRSLAIERETFEDERSLFQLKLQPGLSDQKLKTLQASPACTRAYLLAWSPSGPLRPSLRACSRPHVALDAMPGGCARSTNPPHHGHQAHFWQKVGLYFGALPSVPLPCQSSGRRRSRRAGGREAARSRWGLKPLDLAPV